MKSSKVVLLIIVSIIVLTNFIITIQLISKQSKVVFIDTTVLMSKYRKIVTIKQKLNEESSQWQANIQTLESELTQLNSEMVEQGASWSKEKLAEAQKQNEKKQEEYYRYRRAIEDKAAKREQELLQPVIDELNLIIEDYGKLKGYDLILGTLAGGNVLYGNIKADITTDFLEYANSLSDK
ncbi:MAG: OmpH family outer membrane protein [Candidatus Cloacimonetes bacterium]|nr:OmpH family outer membrane protein [Candidatus Cloacimonadota bacterium]